METIEEHVKRTGSFAASARGLGVDYLTFCRWYKRLYYAGRGWRQIMAEKGLALPVRPVEGADKNV